MHASLRRRVVAVLILAGFLVIGFTARSWAAPEVKKTVMLVPPAQPGVFAPPTDTSTSTDTPTDTATSTPTPMTTQLVISQVYGGGGGTGAPYQYDFVEIFNSGGITVDLSGMSVQYLSTQPQATFFPVTTGLPGTLMPGQYYLVQLDVPSPVGNNTPTNTPTNTPATPTYTPMPTSDATGSTNISSSNGTIALVKSTAALGCDNGSGSKACSAAELALIVDRVGYGAGSFPEGNEAPAPADNTTADFRADNGCTDTNNNGSDFSTSAPKPRNSGSPAYICVVATATPTNTATPTSTDTPTPTDTATDTPTHTPTDTPTGTITVTNTPTDTPTATPSSTPTNTPTDTPTTTASNTPTSTPTGSATSTPTDTPTGSATSTPTNTPTGSVTSTATNTPTATATGSVTVTPTNTVTGSPTPTTVPTRAVVINEVAWAGTIQSSDDEWIELYNTTGFDIDLTGWKLVAVDGTPSINLSGEIPGLGFFLLERSDDCTVSTIGADQIYTGGLTDAGDSLQLLAPKGGTGQFTVVDTANSNGGPWPAGSSGANRNSMERRTGMADSDTAWITNTGILKNGLDAGSSPSGVTPDATCSNNTNKHAIYGTPKQTNWATLVTPTPSPTPYRTPTRTPTYVSYATPVPSHPFVVLNEFLPKPASDWNEDGTTDTQDEFIEIINIGTTQVNLFGWRIDDSDPATPAYAIPGQILTPGQHLAFFESETGLTLPDGGGVVRLYSQSVVVDSYTYPAVTQADISWCRLPDGSGGWVFGCNPTPDEPNQAASGAGGTPFPTGVPTGVPGGEGAPPPPVSSLCQLQEQDFPPAVYSAECYIPGLGVWNPAYWDATSDVFGSMPYEPYYGKWTAYFE